MPAQVQAGDLDRRITFERLDAAAGKTAYNEQREVWTPVVTVWARKNDASDGEAFRALEVGAQLTTRFLIRYSTIALTLTPKDRIRYKTDLYNITGIKEPVGTRNQWLEISAVARADK